MRIENFVKSGKLLTGNAADNPEVISKIKLLTSEYNPNDYRNHVLNCAEGSRVQPKLLG